MTPLSPPKRQRKRAPTFSKTLDLTPTCPASRGAGGMEQKQLPETMQGKPSLLPTPAQCRSTAGCSLGTVCAGSAGRCGVREPRAPARRTLRSCLTARARGPEGRGLRARAAQTPPSEFPGPNLAPASLPRAVPDWPASGSPPFHWSGSDASAYSDWLTSFPGFRSREEPPGRGDSAGVRIGFRYYCACAHLTRHRARSAQAQ